ncbi:MAG: tetratricopeptide repeat protein [Armatimonadetes bacterium]|nr:tetratricopeptide repeat protein [Armatimonadota bacterium]
MSTDLVAKARELLRLDRYEESLTAAKAAEEAAREGKSKVGESDALQTQAQALYMLDRYEESLTAAKAAEEAARVAKSKGGESNALNNQARALRMLDRYEEALTAAKAAEEAAREGKSKLGEGNALYAQSQALRMLNRHQEALTAAKAAEEAAREGKSKLGESNALDSQSQALRMLNRPEESLMAAKGAEEAARESKDRVGEANALGAQGEALLKLGRLDEALEAVEKALAMVPAEGVQGTKSWLAGLRGRAVGALAERGQVGRAQEVVEEVRKSAPDEAPAAEAGLAGFDISTAVEERERFERKFHGRLAQPAKSLTDLGRLPDGAQGALVFLRDWASYSTIPLARVPAAETEERADERVAARGETERPVAGGYLLHWGGKGLAIDPGYGFLGALAEEGLVFGHIDEVLLTHYHFDHLDDLLQLVTCFHEVREAVKKGHVAKEAEHPLRFYVSPSCHDALSAFLRRITGHPAEPVSSKSDDDEHLGLGRRVRLAGTVANHSDLTHLSADAAGESQAIGVRMELRDAKDKPLCTLGLTSDTGWTKEVSEAFAGEHPVDVLVAHMGSAYEEDKLAEKYAENHLGRNGVLKLIVDVARARKKKRRRPLLAVISEWGEELAPYRSEICRDLQNGLKREDLPGRVIPSCRGLYVALPQCEPVCQACRRKYANAWVKGAGKEIIHVCKECLYQ